MSSPPFDENWLEALVIGADGEMNFLTLPEDEIRRLSQLRDLVGGYLEVVALTREQYMLINEEAKFSPHEENRVATMVAHECGAIRSEDYIAGSVVIVCRLAL